MFWTEYGPGVAKYCLKQETLDKSRRSYHAVCREDSVEFYSLARNKTFRSCEPTKRLGNDCERSRFSCWSPPADETQQT